MELSKVNEGYEILCLAFKRKIMESEIEKIHRYFFINKEGKQFVLACENIAKKGEKYPHVSDILREMDNVTIEYDTNELVDITKSTCNKCIRGLIYYEDELGYEYVARCDCEVGINHKLRNLPLFKNLGDAKFIRKNTTNEFRQVSDRECQQKKNEMWKKFGRNDLVEVLPPADTYDNSEFSKPQTKVISSTKEVNMLRNILGGGEDIEKEKERTENIEEKMVEEDELPF